MSTENQQGTISLEKGQRIDLTKSNPGLQVVGLGLGWDVNAGNGSQFDLDAFAIMLNASEKCAIRDSHFVHFNNLKVKGVEHSGDNRTGQGDGDDEVITVNLAELDPSIEHVIFGVNIYQARERAQKFGMVNNAFIRVFDKNTNQEIMKFDLSEEQSTATGMLMGKIYKKDGEWKFNALGTAVNGDLNEIIAPYLS